MNFVHIADIHFDTPFVNLSDRENLGELKRLEQRDVFKKVINYIKENKIENLFISGDLYESQSIRESTIIYINNLFKEIPETKIYISPGNHDPYTKDSFYNKFNWNNNVYIFKNKIEKIETEEADIYGFGFNDFYCSGADIESMKIDNKNKINILIIHGTLDGAVNIPKPYNPISSKLLDEKEFDYVALGHIHKNNINESTKNIYPGSLVAQGFDELGKHGMVVGKIENGILEKEFIEIDQKEFEEIKIDVTEIISFEELIEKINSIENNNKLIKINLI